MFEEEQAVGMAEPTEQVAMRFQRHGGWHGLGWPVFVLTSLLVQNSRPVEDFCANEWHDQTYILTRLL